MSFLGQNFLKDKRVVHKIINYISLKNRSVIEIGGGEGVLSKEIILQSPKSFTIVEKDPTLADYLQKTLNSSCIIINKDVLNYNIDTDVVISNLPYCITSPFFRQLCQSNWNEAIIMIQKDVYDKIVKCDSALSILINIHMSVKLIQHVNPQSFNPVPKVYSSVLHLTNNYYKGNLWNMLRITYNGKNKLIKNIWPTHWLNHLNNIVENLNLNTFRSQDISINLWKKLGEAENMLQ
jgi:16S rRNA (adenine1518-N6/adenine1519-N6)-dimethyltransferase